LAYGAALRACKVVALKTTDIDSARMVIRVEQGKGRKERSLRDAVADIAYRTAQGARRCLERQMHSTKGRHRSLRNVGRTCLLTFRPAVFSEFSPMTDFHIWRENDWVSPQHTYPMKLQIVIMPIGCSILRIM
jgi:hypothetical protein